MLPVPTRSMSACGRRQFAFFRALGKDFSIGFIGTGVMGRSMAANLIKAEYPLSVFNRTPAKAEDLIAAGAKWCDSPASVAESSDVVITIVGFPEDVESTYFGDDGVIKGAKKGSLFIDMTTSSPRLAVRIAESAAEIGCHALDAPVSGGDVGAREARLSIMVGGDDSAYRKALPLFDSMGKTIVHQGPAGSGQYCKMTNQIVIASSMIGIAEAMVYARKAGLDPEVVLQSISSGAAGGWSLSNLAPRMLKGDFEPGFYIKHFIKDLKIALDSATELNLELPGLTLAKKLYDELAGRGLEDKGTQALFQYYR